MLFKSYTAAVVALLFSGNALAHPGGAPRLMGRNGYIDVRDLEPLKIFKRVESPDGSCGGTKGYTCPTTVNKCCSQYGWCGDSDLHCQPSENCQAAFGQCASGGGTGGAGRCGKQGNNAICPTGQCCSEGGYCGTTEDHCMSPLCQVGFGKCDADTTPAGGSTQNVPRPHVGNVLYGNVWDCTVKGDIALTFDDGPDVYTDGMVDLLNQYNAKATFFVTGINNGKGAIDTTPAWSSVITKMHNTGHQIASHTWSHADLSLLTEDARRTEMYKLEMALRNILGFFPTYMRPPYSSCNDACVQTMSALGYHVTHFDLDTDDYNQATPEKVQVAKNNFANAINPSNPANDAFLAIAHDIHQTTAQNLTEFMLQTLTAKGYRAVTVGECLGDPKANWYRSAGAGTPSSTAQPSSTVAPTNTVVPPTSTTATAAPTSTCAYTVGTWCATPLPTYDTVSACWTTVGNCWDQGDQCWNTVNSNDCIKYQDVCQTQETHCQQCADSGSQTCAFLPPVYV